MRNHLILSSEYLSDRRQKTKVGSTFSEFLDVLFCVHFFSNIYFYDTFFKHNSTEFSSYAGSNIPYLYGFDYDMLLKELEDTNSSTFFWCRETSSKQILIICR